MKKRFLLLLISSFILFVIINGKGEDIRTSIFNLILNPIKTEYRGLTRELENKGKSYIFQEQTIEKLQKENRVLRKYLLDQTHYLKQLAQIYKIVPTLRKLPYKSITLVNTVSYVKLNKFDEVLLTMPKKYKLKENRVYGLIQNEVVAGVAKVDKGILYGYLISNPKCQFSVYIGKNRYPGIAEGVNRDSMVVKFIPKWAKIKIGDRVETSGLDKIFFSNIPVGVVTSIKKEGSYNSAYIKTYADIMHPELFFLITDTTPYLASYYDANKSFPNTIYPYSCQAKKILEENISSIPKVLQTKDLEVNPSDFEIPEESPKVIKKIKKTEQKEKSKKKNIKKPQKTSTQPKTPVKKLQTQNTKEQDKQTKAPKEEKKDIKKEYQKHPSPFDILNSPFI